MHLGVAPPGRHAALIAANIDSCSGAAMLVFVKVMLWASHRKT